MERRNSNFIFIFKSLKFFSFSAEASNQTQIQELTRCQSISENSLQDDASNHFFNSLHDYTPSLMLKLDPTKPKMIVSPIKKPGNDVEKSKPKAKDKAKGAGLTNSQVNVNVFIYVVTMYVF